jgi:glutamine---fructose-6-phosphate transaminase (isomerizing)
MCGIFAYIGPRNPAKTCLKGLKQLEYRGYDSAGVAGVEKGMLITYKAVGKLSALEHVIERCQNHQLHLAIAHTRWATHGKPTEENAHPHFDQIQSLAVVHNGIIENHFALRSMLQEKGRHFYSDTDTEVIAQLISHFYQNDLLSAVKNAISLLKGSWALAIIHKDHPDQIIVAAYQNSIAIGCNLTHKEVFISSDTNAFCETDLEVMFLHSKEIACISSQKIQVFDNTHAQINKPTKHFEIEKTLVSKNGYPHFMLKEIFEQPKVIQYAFHNRLLRAQGSVFFEELLFTSEELIKVRQILIIACGSSWHAGLLAAAFFQEQARIPTQAHIASEFRYSHPILSKETLVIAISQSGETLDTLAAVREVKKMGAKVLGICNVAHSSLAREADSTLFLKAGTEISVCSTKAFTNQLIVLFLFSLQMARLRQMDLKTGQYWINEIEAIPKHIETILQQKETISYFAKQYARLQHFFFLGRSYMYPTSLEAALKLKEISYINAQAYPAGEMKHGPIALVDHSLAVIALCGNTHTMEKMLGNLIEIQARNAPILAFAPQSCLDVSLITNQVIWLPSSPDALSCIPYSVATQLFAYSIALEKGTDIDQPRNLAKSVTVE